MIMNVIAIMTFIPQYTINVARGPTGACNNKQHWRRRCTNYDDVYSNCSLDSRDNHSIKWCVLVIVYQAG